MSTQMEVDDNATATTLSRTSCVEPSVKNFSFCQEREEIVHRLFFWCHEDYGLGVDIITVKCTKQ